MSKGKRRLGRKSWFVIVAVLAVAAFALSRGGGSDQNKDAKKDDLKTAKVEKGDVQVRVSEVGSVEPQVKVDVKSVLSGKVVALMVREGDKVRKGQIIAQVEPDPSQARDLAQVKNSVTETEIALNEARATNDRNEGLKQQGLLSLQAALEMETRFKSARAQHDAAVERYKIVQESGVPIGLVSGSSTQRLNVSAPMDGVIIRRTVELGDTVTSGVSSFNAGTVIATVADVETMIIKAGINEVDIGKVRLGQEVKITLDAYPKVRFSGRIGRIAPAARLEEKVKIFEVEVDVDRQGQELRTGMTANLNVLGDRVEGVLTAPVEALFKRDDKEVVYVKKPEAPKVSESKGFFSSVFAADKDATATAGKVDEKDKWKAKFELREVETGLASFDKAEIVKGLKAGEEVAVEDPTRPKEKKSND
ncbi:MAG: efflux RND transporter periplasmic adaptor subunit [Vicinamibacteria bacterium]|nr:efflux RND transporter periplasmic adaptor subunit [Vicinamibacteria bacterium]